MVVERKKNGAILILLIELLITCINLSAYVGFAIPENRLSPGVFAVTKGQDA